MLPRKDVYAEAAFTKLIRFLGEDKNQYYKLSTELTIQHDYIIACIISSPEIKENKAVEAINEVIEAIIKSDKSAFESFLSSKLNITNPYLRKPFVDAYDKDIADRLRKAPTIPLTIQPTRVEIKNKNKAIEEAFTTQVKNLFGEEKEGVFNKVKLNEEADQDDINSIGINDDNKAIQDKVKHAITLKELEPLENLSEDEFLRMVEDISSAISNVRDSVKIPSFSEKDVPGEDKYKEVDRTSSSKSPINPAAKTSSSEAGGITNTPSSSTTSTTSTSSTTTTSSTSPVTGSDSKPTTTVPVNPPVNPTSSSSTKPASIPFTPTVHAAKKPRLQTTRRAGVPKESSKGFEDFTKITPQTTRRGAPPQEPSQSFEDFAKDSPPPVWPRTKQPLRKAQLRQQQPVLPQIKRPAQQTLPVQQPVPPQPLANRFGNITPADAAKLVEALHKLNSIMKDHDTLSDLNDTLTQRSLRGRLLRTTPTGELHTLKDFKEIERLVDDIYPLGEKTQNLLKNNDQDAYKAFKEAAYNLEIEANRFTKERGLLFKSRQGELRELTQGTERLIEQIQASIGSRAGSADDKERKRNLERCMEQITTINAVIGQMQAHKPDVYQSDIATLVESRKKLNKMVEKTLTKPDHKKVRTYSPEGSRAVELQGATDADKIQHACRELGLPSNIAFQEVALIQTESNKPFVKFAKAEETGKFRIDPGMIEYIRDSGDVAEYKSQFNIQNDDTEIKLKMSSGVGVVGNTYMSIMNYGNALSAKNDDGEYLVPDEKVYEYMMRVVLKFHADLPASDKGKRLIFSDAVHPRAVQAAFAVCENSPEKFQKPRAPASFNPDMVTKSYVSKMEKISRNPNFKARVKGVEDAAISATEEQIRTKPTLGDKIGMGLGYTKKP